MVTKGKKAGPGKGPALKVWLDDPAFGPLQHIGTLHKISAEQMRFCYDAAWLNNPMAFVLDPELALGDGDFYPRNANFGIFMDSCPDRWGQVLMQRREAVEARENNRTARTVQKTMDKHSVNTEHLPRRLPNSGGDDSRHGIAP